MISRFYLGRRGGGGSARVRGGVGKEERWGNWERGMGKRREKGLRRVETANEEKKREGVDKTGNRK